MSGELVHDIDPPRDSRDYEDYWYSWYPSDDWFCSEGEEKEE